MKSLSSSEPIICFRLKKYNEKPAWYITRLQYFSRAESLWIVYYVVDDMIMAPQGHLQPMVSSQRQF